MQRLEEEFLEAVESECLSRHNQTDRLIFKRRFDPKFHDKSGTEPQTNDQIYRKVAKELSIEKLPTAKNLQRIIKALVDKFEAQMRKNEVDVDFLKSGEREGGGKWSKVFNWLWGKYYPRWYSDNESRLLEQQWQKLVDKADKTDDWLEVREIFKERNFEVIETPQPTIPLKSEICLQVNWQGNKRYLLLLNQGTNGDKSCMCPSKYFAPSYELVQKVMRIPQKDVKNSLRFLAQGKEHFLGIVMEEPLNLPWFYPHNEEKVPTLDAARLNELLVKLEEQNCEIFYKSYEVVS